MTATTNDHPSGPPQTGPRLPAALARSTAVAAAAVGVTVAAGSWLHGDRLASPIGHPLRALAAYGLLLLPLFLFLRTHLPHPRFGAANTVTLFRAGLVCLLAAAIGEPWTGHAGWIAAVATLALVLDGVDGWLARSRALESPFGARFDLEIDAALGLVLALLVWQAGSAGAWVLAAGLPRYVFLIAMRPLPWLAAPLPPSTRRKTVCVLQLALLIAAIAPVLPTAARTAAAAASALLVGWSFAIDVAWLAANRSARPVPDEAPT